MNIIKLNTIGDIVKRVEGGSAPIANQSKEVVITENGTTTIKPDAGYTGLGSVKIVVALPIDVSNYLTMEALDDDFTVTTGEYGNGLQYCIDGSGLWKNLPRRGTTQAISNGQKISFKCQTNSIESISGVFKATSGRCNLSGNIMSLLYGDSASVNSPLINEREFFNLFRDMDGIIDASRLLLPAKNLTPSCYSGMFLYCKNLVAAPALPATTLAEYCYDGMFSGCTSLNAPPALPATTLAANCYEDMFEECTSLTTPPELPAMMLANSCYYGMFSKCTSLVKAPELPATTDAINCYNRMFMGCSNLSYIKAMLITMDDTSSTFYWLRNVSPTGTFVKNAAATWDVVGPNGVPEGWTVETATE